MHLEKVKIVSQHPVFRLQLIESSALNPGGNFGDSPGHSATYVQRSNTLVCSFAVAEWVTGSKQKPWVVLKTKFLNKTSCHKLTVLDYHQ